VWGNCLLAFFLCGFIPTRVGETDQWGLDHQLPLIHPHACGGNTMALAKQLFPKDSSPRVWGKLPFNSNMGFLMRFIPTRVGETGGYDRLFSLYKIHPHACGGNVTKCFVSQLQLCSMWPVNMAGRFIPTRVGETRAVADLFHPLQQPPQIHPHACGGNPVHCLNA
jgi:hypothetical protein